jgi:hypothetical protein
MSYNYSLDQRQIEIIKADEKGHYYIYWENLPVGFVYRLEIGTDVGKVMWAGSSPYLTFHAEEIGLYIQQCNM